MNQDVNNSREFSISKQSILVILALICTFGPMLFFYFRQQWNRPEYQAFPLVLASAGLLLLIRIRESESVNRFTLLASLMSFVALGLSLCLLFVSYLVFSPWLAMGAFIVAIFALFVNLWRFRKVEGLFGIWATLFLLIPPPLDRDQMLIEYLQLTSSRLTSVILDRIGVMHLMQGNALHLSDRDFFVAEACSGIVSLISILSIIAIFCIWKRFRLGASTFLIASGAIWAILMNTVRLTIIAIAWFHFKIDLAEGVPHTLLALIIFLLSLIVLFTLSKIADFVFAPIERKPASNRKGHSLDFLITAWNRWIANDDHEPDEPSPSRKQQTIAADLFKPTSVFGQPTLMCMSGVGILMAAIYIPTENKHAKAIEDAITRAIQIDRDFDIGGSEASVDSFSNERRELFRWDRWGQHSRTFGIHDVDGQEYLISCDFMFGPHWHDLRKCYRGTGWKITDETVTFVDDLGKIEFANTGHKVTDSISSDWTVERFHVERTELGDYGFVAYAAFQADGKHFNRPRGDGLLSNFWVHLVQGRDRAEQADYFQVQISTFGDHEISSEQVVRAELFLQTALKRFYAEIAAPDESSLQFGAIATNEVK